MNSSDHIREMLFAARDLKYRDFNASLIPTADSERMIGVRIPAIRELAKKISGTEEAKEFISVLPHDYYEENCLHAFLIERIKDFDGCIAQTERFLPYIDNWAVCDMMSPKVFAKNTDKLLPLIWRWMDRGDVYTVRYAVGMLMRYYLGDTYDRTMSDAVVGVDSSEYYINMMLAWYFATALAKRYDDILPYFKDRRIANVWVHNKAIQKATESRRITEQQKDELRQLRIK